MRSAAAALAGLAAVVATASAVAAVTPPPPRFAPPARSASDLRIAVSSHRAGAAVTMTLSYPALLQCGRPRATTSVLLPASAAVPATIASAAVRLNGQPAGSVAVREHVLTATPPKVHGMICDSLVTSRVTLVVTAAARLANPSLPGTYTVEVASAGSTHSGTYTVS